MKEKSFDESMVGKIVEFGYLSKRALEDNEQPATIVGRVVKWVETRDSVQLDKLDSRGEVVETKWYNGVKADYSMPEVDGQRRKVWTGNGLTTLVTIIGD